MTITVEELDTLCAAFIAKKDYQKKSEKRLDEIKAETREAQSKVIAALEALNKTENEGGFGKVKISQREYYKMIDREQAMNWLKEVGEFDHLATVNAATFSSYVKGLVHDKRKDGDYVWVPPGVEDSTSDYTYLKITV